MNLSKEHKSESLINPEGRPLKFETPQAMQKKIDKYFLDCEKKEKPLTITGLALALDTSRKVLLDYEDNRPEYSNTIKKAKVICENFVEEYLFTGKNMAGAIFNLKNNYGWKEDGLQIAVGIKLLVDT